MPTTASNHRSILLAALVGCCLTLLSALVVATLALLTPVLTKGQPISWFLFGFEVVVIVATVLGILLSRGKWNHGLGLGFLSIGGTIFLASAMGWQGANRLLVGQSLTPLLLARTAVAGLLTLIAINAVLSRRPQAWPRAILGAALGLPVLALAGAFVVPAARQKLLGALPTNLGITIILAVGGFIVFTALLAASVQILVGAFQSALRDDQAA
ncbi:MAG: hypothetical protein ACKVW3_15465 [Phycisphaerales bacterium]